MGAGLGRYIARRLIEIPIVLFFVIIVNFTIIHLAPGDPATTLLGEFGFAGGIPTENLQLIRAKWGLDKPLVEQLAIYVTTVARGDLGFSIAFNRPVLQLIFERIGATLLLLLIAELIAIGLGTLLGTFAARRHPSAVDTILSGTSITLHSVPVFWSGLMLVLVFAIRLRVLPTSGMSTAGLGGDVFSSTLDVARHLILPVLALVLYLTPVFLRVTRASVLEVANEDYVRTARSKGLSENVVFTRHALRNAILPTVTVASLWLGSALSGAVLTETVFAWPGIGRLLFESISLRDYPLLMGILIVSSMGVVVISFLADMLYIRLDPRIVFR
jgi:peptide/nickel transport system permease protein